MKFRIATITAAAMLAGAWTGSAALTVVNGELAGPTDWLADVRLRNFNSTISDYEMMVNASPTRGVGQNQVNGQVPGPYAWADWAENNAFTITYDPLANAGAGLVSLRLVGSGDRQLGTTGGYDVTISRAPDAVAGAVNYINFQLWDRVNFPTFSSLMISSLDGNNLGSFLLPAAGIGSWSILDPLGATLNNGFVLQGSFVLNLANVAEGKEGDKLIWAIGNNPNVPVPEPSTYIAGALLLLPFAASTISKLRKNRTA
jgi:hypothetical protein